MWLLSLLPDFVFHIVLLIGVLGLLASWVLRMIPFVSVYSLQIQVIAIILVVAGVWFEGGMANEASWQAKVHDLELKVAVAEKAAAEANGRIEYVYVDRIKVVKDTQYVVLSELRENAAKIDKTCTVDTEAVNILNKAAHPTTGQKK